MPATCLIFIWLKFCVLRLLTVLILQTMYTECCLLWRGKKKPLHSAATSGGLMPAATVTMYVNCAFVPTLILYIAHYQRLPMLEVRTQTQWCFAHYGLSSHEHLSVCWFWKQCNKAWHPFLRNQQLIHQKRQKERGKSHLPLNFTVNL